MQLEMDRSYIFRQFLEWFNRSQPMLCHDAIAGFFFVYLDLLHLKMERLTIVRFRYAGRGHNVQPRVISS